VTLAGINRAETLALRLAGVSKTYHQPGQIDVVALNDVSLEIARGEFVVIVGHNGSGKTTLLNIVAGDVLPDCGLFSTFGSNDRARIARVRQSPGEGTFDDLTVAENFQLFVAEGRPSPFRVRVPTDVVLEATRRLAEYGLSARLNDRVCDLSQGQRQILALELAMMRRPELLLLDEHTASLDRVNAAMCMEATMRLARETGTTVLMVTHNFGDALSIGDTLVVMRDGKIAHRMTQEAKKTLSLENLLVHCGFMS